jgi:hypothetical protein
MAKDDHSKAMPPAFAKFFADALPNDGGNHTLCLGEHHADTEHLDFLSMQLESLHRDHNLQTLGLERSTFYNIFLWAYRDGKLTELLGSQEAARNYVKNIFTAGLISPDYIETIQETMTVALKAIDMGMNVNAYDSRDTLLAFKKGYGDRIDVYNNALACVADEKKSTTEAVRQQRRYSAQNDRGIVWPLTEAEWLLNRHPKYAAKLAALETLLATGHQKINEGKLTSDGLSAIVFNAMAEDGNRLTLGGSRHVSGFGYRHPSISVFHQEHIHGTFAHHLFAAGQPKEAQQGHTVTHAVIATAAVATEHHEQLWKKYCKTPTSLALAGHRVPWLNLDDGSTDKLLWHPEDDDPNHPRIVPLEEKFPIPPDASPNEIPAIQKAHINPLLMPDIKTAHDAVREVMHGKDVGLQPR